MFSVSIGNSVEEFLSIFLCLIGLVVDFLIPQTQMVGFRYVSLCQSFIENYYSRYLHRYPCNDRNRVINRILDYNTHSPSVKCRLCFHSFSLEVIGSFAIFHFCFCFITLISVLVLHLFTTNEVFLLNGKAEWGQP